MSIETKSMHITPVGGNVFADLGFEPDEAARLLAESDAVISEKLAIKDSLKTDQESEPTFKTFNYILNALSFAERRAVKKESRRMLREMQTSMRQSHRDTLMWYADWVRQPYHDDQLESDMAGAWVLIESMKIGADFLAKEMWSLPAWQRVVQLHFMKKIRRNPNWIFALECRPAWLDDGIWIENRRKYFASWGERSRDKQLLRLAQQLCSSQVARK